ncbi:MAG: DUF2110 family protein [Candidatus Bathyarchaeota archaeon]|nr:DUF2110 family protein [Candidatus Bathyarchaeota archaeon]
MPMITLLEKVYGPFSQKILQVRLASLCKDLMVKAKVVSKTSRGWVQVELTGEDQTVAIEFLDREIGVAPVGIDEVKRFSTIKGMVIFAGEKEQELLVDIGVYSPRVYDATVSLERLRAQLADGKKLPLQRLIELFCLYDFMPLHVKITRDVKLEHEQVEAELSETQLSKFIQWMASSLDRLIVLGATLSQVKHAIRVSGHNRDIIRVETLGLLEHAVVCKLGTDAIGLTPKLGPHLYTATLAPFSPRKIRQTINRSFL